MARRLAVGAALGCAFLFTNLGARAQSEVGKADALFNAGRSLLEAGEYSDACPKFAESQKLASGLGVTLYLADCYERLGRTASALAEFRRAVSIASARKDKRGIVAEERASNLEGRVPELVIVVTAAARAQGVTVTRDGEGVPSTQWGTPMRTDPGVHEIVVTAPSKVTRRLTATLLAEKGVITTTVDGLEDPQPESRASPSTSQNHPGENQEPSQTRRWVSFALGGAGVVGVGVGVVLGALAVSNLHASNDGPCNAADQCTPGGQALRQDALHFANGATGAFVVGGAALAAGGVLYFTIPKPRASGAGLRIRPILSPQGTGVLAGSSF
jgi:hypothetical protein